MVKESPQRRAYVTSGMFFERWDLAQSTPGKNTSPYTGGCALCPCRLGQAHSVVAHRLKATNNRGLEQQVLGSGGWGKVAKGGGRMLKTRFAVSNFWTSFDVHGFVGTKQAPHFIFLPAFSPVCSIPSLFQNSFLLQLSVCTLSEAL